MEELKYYRTLGLPPGADISQIKTAYRSLAKRLHPDLSSDPSTSDNFRQVVTAYKGLVARQQKRELLNTVTNSSYRSSGYYKSHSIQDIGKLLFEGKTPAMRAFAARRLGLSGKKGTYYYLKKGLSDESETVVLAVIQAIGNLKVFSALDDLLAVFDSGSRTVQLQVLNVIEKMELPIKSKAIVLHGMQSLDRSIRLKSLSIFAKFSKEKAI